MIVKSGIVFNSEEPDTTVAILKSYDIENHTITIKTVSNLPERYRNMLSPGQEYNITNSGIELPSGYTISLSWLNDNINECEISIRPTYEEYYALYWIDEEDNPRSIGKIVETESIEGVIVNGYITIDSNCSEFQQFKVTGARISANEVVTIPGFPNNKIIYQGENKFVFEAGIEYYKVVYT